MTGAVSTIFLWLSAVGPAFAEKAVGPMMCACPGRHRPLGSAASCEEACYGKSGSGGSAGSSSNPAMEALTPLIRQGIQELFKEEDPAVRAQRLELERQRAVEAARLKKEKDDKLDSAADSLLGLTDDTRKV